MKSVKLLLSLLFLAVVLKFAVEASPPAVMPASPVAPTYGQAGCGCSKVHHGAKGVTCAPPPSPAAELNLSAPFGLGKSAADAIMSRRVSVAALVERALVDQRAMLRAKVAELERWGPGDRVVFAKWFGTSHEQARRLIRGRVLRVLEVSNNYSFRNFRRANPPRPNVYAYVYAGQPSKLYVDNLFVRQVAAGENSRAGTITHEMSHFTIAGGTKDHAYGQVNCKQLARTNPFLALTNADNFEYWAEGAQ